MLQAQGNALQERQPFMDLNSTLQTIHLLKRLDFCIPIIPQNQKKSFSIRQEKRMFDKPGD
jgi:hypothetical protein